MIKKHFIKLTNLENDPVFIRSTMISMVMFVPENRIETQVIVAGIPQRVLEKPEEVLNKIKEIEE